jgi:hypothetical protein
MNQDNGGIPATRRVVRKLDSVPINELRHARLHYAVDVNRIGAARTRSEGGYGISP